MRFWIWKLALRYLFPKHRMGTFFTWASIVGIAAGVMILCVVLSIMNGFDENIETKLVQINGKIKILSQNPIRNYENLIQRLRSRPHVLGVSPFVQGIALVQKDGRVIFPKCFGFDKKTVDDVLPFSKFILSDNGTCGAFIPKTVSRELGLAVGDTFDLYSPLALESIKNEEMILPQEIPVAGYFKTDWAEVDRNTIFFPMELLQEAYGMEGMVHGFSLDVEDRYLRSVCEDLNAWLPSNMHAYTWHELNEDFLHVLRMEKAMSFFVLLFIVLVAAITISSGLMTSVVRKQREISLFLHWGASRLQIVCMFCCQGLILSVFGIVLGLTTAGIVLHFRNAIVQFLTGWFLPKDALWNFYSFEQLPAVWCWKDIALILVFSLIITLLASLLPAWKATRTSIIKGLRRE